MLKLKKFNMIFTISLILLISLTSTIFAYSYAGDRWRATSASYRIDSSVSSSWVSAIQSGASTWNNAGSKFSFYEDSSSGNYVESGDLGGLGGYIALATYTSGTDGFTDKTKITFNKSLYFNTNGDSNAFDVRTIATHEFGHWLTLNDLYDSISGENKIIMYGYFDRGEIRRTLTSDDILGIKNIYGSK
jgi:hypothetical protein